MNNSITINGVTYEPEITDEYTCDNCDLKDEEGIKQYLSCGNICNTFECILDSVGVIMKKV